MLACEVAWRVEQSCTNHVAEQERNHCPSQLRRARAFFQSRKTGVLTAICRTKLDHGVIPDGDGLFRATVAARKIKNLGKAISAHLLRGGTVFRSYKTGVLTSTLELQVVSLAMCRGIMPHELSGGHLLCALECPSLPQHLARPWCRGGDPTRPLCFLTIVSAPPSECANVFKLSPRCFPGSRLHRGAGAAQPAMSRASGAQVQRGNSGAHWTRAVAVSI